MPTMQQKTFLQSKIKKSPVFKIVTEKLYQKVKPLQNDIYQRMKQKRQQQSKIANTDAKFEKQIDQKMSKKAPYIVARLSRMIEQKQKKQNRSKSVSISLQKKKYQTTTVSSNRKKTRRTMSMMLTEEELNSIYQYKDNPPVQEQKEQQQKQQQEKLSPATQTDYFSNRFKKFRKVSQNMIQSLQKSKKKCQIFNQLNDKINKHFSELIVDVVDFDQFDITAGQRHKFSSNKMLDNVLTRKDEQVRDWIRQQKLCLLRKNGAKVIKGYHEVSNRKMRLYSHVPSSKVSNHDKVDMDSMQKQIKGYARKLKDIKIEKNILEEKQIGRKNCNAYDKFKELQNKKYHKKVSNSYLDSPLNFKKNAINKKKISFSLSSPNSRKSLSSAETCVTNPQSQKL